jgi:hypothetical protein
MNRHSLEPSHSFVGSSVCAKTFGASLSGHPDWINVARRIEVKITLSQAAGAAIALVGTADGTWHGTWQVRTYTTEPVDARLAAEDPARGLRGEANASTGLLSFDSPPTLTSENVVSAAQVARSQPIAPGGMISIYGEFLAESQAAAASIPLPQRLGNAEVVIAGQRMPLLFASQGQITR